MTSSKHLIEFLRVVQKYSGFAAIGLIALLFLPLFIPLRVHTSGRPESERYGCSENLRQIHRALLAYHAKHQCFPPAFVRGPDGKPWHSWRVLILPYLDQKKLYEQYSFDEPWDGPNNRKLLARRPNVFKCDHANSAISSTGTSYLAIVGSDAAWLGDTPTSLDNLYTSERAGIVLLVEAKDSGIAWLAPDDLTLEEASAIPSGLSGRRPSSDHVGRADTGGAHVLLADGRVEFIRHLVESSKNIDAKTWHAMLTGAHTNGVKTE